MNEHNCRVCGLFITNLPWGENGNSPSYEICPCCGVEFGNEDYTINSTRQYRNKWVLKGGNWFFPSEKPQNWNIEEQFNQIPKEWL